MLFLDRAITLWGLYITTLVYLLCKLCLAFIVTVVTVFSIIQMASCDDGKIAVERRGLGLHEANDNQKVNQYFYDGAHDQNEISERADSVRCFHLCMPLIVLMIISIFIFTEANNF